MTSDCPDCGSATTTCEKGVCPDCCDKAGEACLFCCIDLDCRSYEQYWKDHYEEERFDD